MTIRKAFWQLALTTTILAGMGGAAFALPEGGVVTGGNADIHNVANGVDVNQHSQRAVIDWQKFNIADHERVRFFQPGSSSVALNRIHDLNPSQIYGQLQANGILFLVNNNGFVFGSGAQIDVGSLVATTSNITNNNFMAGIDVFNQPGNPQAHIINHGGITAAQAGLVGLVAPQVTNNGLIQARLGRVHLASGDTFSVDLAGDGLLSIAVSDDVHQQLVKNSGLLTAAGGQVLMTAAAGSALATSLIDNSGIIQANAVDTDSGRIILRADSQTANIDVSGTLSANAADHGDGGDVIVLSAGNTRFTGHAEAKGGSQSGDGGFVEVSGKEYLDMRGTVDTSAANGQTGQLLLDPGDIEICQFGGSANAACNPAGAPEIIPSGGTFDSGGNAISYVNIGDAVTPGTLLGLLQSTNVTVQTNAAGAGSGDITVTDAIDDTGGAGNGLTLNAHNNIVVNAPITVQDLTLEAGSEFLLNAPIASSANGTLTLQPRDTTSIMSIADNTGDVLLQAASLDMLQDGWSEIHLGRAVNDGGLLLGAYSNWKDPVIFHTGTGGGDFFGDQAASTADAGFTTVGSFSFLGANLTTLGGNIDFQQSVILSGDSVLSTNGGDIIFGDDPSDLQGAHNLTLNAGTGDVYLDMVNIGALTPLQSFTAIGSNIILPPARATDIRTVGNISLTGNMLLPNTVGLQTDSGDILLGGAMDGAQLLSISTNSGRLLSSAAIGTVTPLIALSFTGLNAAFSDTLAADSVTLQFTTPANETYGIGTAADHTLSAASIANIYAGTNLTVLTATEAGLHLGALTLNSPTWLLAFSDISLHGQITAHGAGNAVVLGALGPGIAGGDFHNLHGANALQTPNGRTLIYSTRSDQDTQNGLNNFDGIYGETFLTLPPDSVPGVNDTFVYLDANSPPPPSSSSSSGGGAPPVNTQLPYNVELTINNNVALLSPLPPVARVDGVDEVTPLGTDIADSSGGNTVSNGNDTDNKDKKKRRE